MTGSDSIPPLSRRVRSHPDKSLFKHSSDMKNVKSDRDTEKMDEKGESHPQVPSIYLSFPQDRIHDSMNSGLLHMTLSPMIQSDAISQSIRDELLFMDGMECFDVVGVLVPLAENLIEFTTDTDSSLLELLSAVFYRQIYRECGMRRRNWKLEFNIFCHYNGVCDLF